MNLYKKCEVLIYCLVKCVLFVLKVTSLLEEKSHLESQTSASEKSTSDDIDDPNTTAGKKYFAVQQQVARLFFYN